MKKNWLFEAPISDYLPDDVKNRIERTAKNLYDNPENKAPSSQEFTSLMFGLPNIESSHKSDLQDLALVTFFNMYPHIKNGVDNGKIKVNAILGQGSGGRRLSQEIPTTKIEKAKQVDSSFDERIKQRHIQNALTQGAAWRDGFNAVNNIEDELNSIDPRLVDLYKKFGSGASRFYWENTAQLERMAQSVTGRVAYCDVYLDKNGVWIIDAAAPNFPLLMHELVKGARYYDSIFTLPKNKEVGDTIMGVADAHKHEIKNMNYGRALIEQLRFLWDMELDGYSYEIEPDLLLMLAQEFEGKPDDYNKMMLGVFKNDKEQIDRFLDLSQEIIDDINYEKKKEKPLEKMKFEKKKPIEPEEKEDDDDDFNPDDWDTFDFDDEDED
jgi:hypothetical protein